LAQSIGIINKEYSLYGTPIKENVKDLNDLIFK
jgi:hypothetical protein